MSEKLTHLWKVDPHTGDATRIDRVDNDKPSFIHLGGWRGFGLDQNEPELNATLIAQIEAAGVDPARLNILAPKFALMENGGNPDLDELRRETARMSREIVESCIYPTPPSTKEEAALRASRVTLMGFSYGAELMESIILHAQPGTANLAGAGLGNLLAPSTNCSVNHSLHVYSASDASYPHDELFPELKLVDRHFALNYGRLNGGLVLIDNHPEKKLYAASLHTNPGDPAPCFASRWPRKTPDDWRVTSEIGSTTGHNFHLYTNTNYPNAGPRIIERRGKDPLAVYASLPSAAVTQAYLRMAIEASFADTPRDMPALLRTLEETMLTREKRDFLADECAKSPSRLQHLLGRNDQGR